MTATYKPEGITRKRRLKSGNHPGVRERRGKPISIKYRQISLRVPIRQYNSWLVASAAIEYRDLRNWLIYLADREAEASINPS